MEQKCACHTSLKSDRVRVQENPCYQMYRVNAMKVPRDQCTPSHGLKGWKATSTQCWLARCDVPRARADFPENDRVATSDLLGRQNVQSKARSSVLAIGVSVPGRGRVC